MTRTFMVCISCNKNWRTVDQYCKKRIIDKKKKKQLNPKIKWK